MELARELISPLDEADLLAKVQRALAVYTFQPSALFPAETNWGGRSFGRHLMPNAITIGRRLAAARLVRRVITLLKKRDAASTGPLSVVEYPSDPIVVSLF